MLKWNVVEALARFFWEGNDGGVFFIASWKHTPLICRKLEAYATYLSNDA